MKYNKPKLYVSEDLYESYKELYKNTYEIIVVPKMKKWKNETNLPVCNKCGSTEITIERRPDGYKTCRICNYSEKNYVGRLTPFIEDETVNTTINRCSHCKPNILCGNTACPFLTKITC